LDNSSESRFFVFCILPFGLPSAPHIFTKSVRPLVKYWSLQGIRLAVFLDDGWVTEGNYHTSKRISNVVRKDLSSAGFIAIDDKSIWEPCQIIEWLGLSWNSKDATV